MAKEKQDTGFTVTDRRLFTTDGDLRSDHPEERRVEEAKPETPAPPATTAVATPEAAPSDLADSKVPPPPSAAEQKASDDAYKQSSKDLDARVELSGHSAKEFEITFERFMASLYMSAMMQMGMMAEEGAQPRIDLIGARQTIDTLGLLQTKTKGNLTSTEEHFLQNCLYELRMAYVEVTNALARPPQAPSPAAGGKTR
ncbi:MAG TPA: DUF1844 domain-containing protein [Terriglobales bacterium]|jgi:hypothetical protein|nr:DUF1844 domain-containing protein [Terriglobales bacterium]